MSAIAPASSSAYLRHLAAKFESSTTPTHRATADRLHAIAVELDELLAMSEGAPVPAERGTSGRSLTKGTDETIKRLRAAQAAPAPTPEQLEELRAERKGSGT
jgi:hypothetical protein